MSVYDDLKWFDEREFDHPDEMDPDFLRLLDTLRERCGFPILLTNDYRTESDMERIYGPDRSEWANSPHQRGLAVDCQPIPNTSKKRMRLVFEALHLWRSGSWPNLGIEIATRHIHLDADTELRRPHLWIGVSK